MKKNIIPPDDSVPDSPDDDGSKHYLRPIKQGELGTVLNACGDNLTENEERVSAFIKGERQIIKKIRKEYDFKLRSIFDSVNKEFFPSLITNGEKKMIIINNFWKYFRCTLRTYQNQEEEENEKRFIDFEVLAITQAVFYFRDRLKILSLIENDDKVEKELRKEHEGCLFNILDQTIQDNYSFLSFTLEQKKATLDSFWENLHKGYKNKKEYIPAKLLSDLFKKEGTYLFQTFLEEKAKQFFFDYILVSELKKQTINQKIYKLFESLAQDKLESAIIKYNIKDEVTGELMNFKDFYTELFGDLLADGKIYEFNYLAAFFTWIYSSPARTLANRHKRKEESLDNPYEPQQNRLKDDDGNTQENDLKADILSEFDPNLDENRIENSALWELLVEIMKKEKGKNGERYMKVRRLRYIENKTYGEIAYELGISEDNARKILSRSQDPLNAIINNLHKTGKIWQYI